VAARARTIDSGGGLDGRDVSYILTTGNTWKSGIEDFTLNVVKHKPDELVTLCFPGTLRKVDALTFRVRLRNFRRHRTFAFTLPMSATATTATPASCPHCPVNSTSRKPDSTL